MAYVLALTVLATLFFATPSLGQTAVADPKSRSYGADWGQPQRHPALDDFRNWANNYRLMAAPDARGQSVAQGIALARQRRVAFADLIQRNPAQAIAAAVPLEIRQQLPAEVVTELESQVSGIGDYSVLGAIRAEGGPAVEPIRRFVTLNGQTYRASTYGRRTGLTTKNGIPLHGIVVDGIMAVHESALRELEPGEALDASLPVVDVSAAAKPAGGPAPVFAELGGKIYRFGSRAELQQAETRIAAAEAVLGPEPATPAVRFLEEGGPGAASASEPPNENSPYTEGNKQVLIIRVDFSDLAGDPRRGSTIYTAAYVQNLSDTQISPFYQQSSYGLTSLTNTPTPLYRMPRTAADYATSGDNTGLHNDARAAAAADYTVSNYHRVLVLFSNLGGISGSRITYGGLGQVGGRNAWINGFYDFRVVAHELGHTYGVFHANTWRVSDGNPISPSGSSVEYEDDFDVMGSNFPNDTRTDFNPWFKNRLDWIPNTKVQTVTASGIYRVNRFDGPSNTGILALKIAKDTTTNYWVGCRRKFTNNPSLFNGAYVVWGYNTNKDSDLLDMTTPGTNDADAALAIGATFTDAAANVTLRPVAQGGTAPNQYIDVQVVFGSAGNKPPYGLYQRGGSYFTNTRGQQEKYFGGTSSLNGYNDPNGYWYYILPSGDLYEYTPPYSNPALTGVLVAQLGTAYYNNPDWLTYSLYQRGGSYYTNYRGQQEKYLGGTASANGFSDPGGYWYFILPSGDLHEFTPPYSNPALTGVLLARLGTVYYDYPALLPVKLHQRGGSYFTNYRGQQEKYLGGLVSARGYTDSSGYWYYILPNGNLYEFTPPYSNPALTGVLLEQLGSTFYNDPSPLLTNGVQIP